LTPRQARGALCNKASLRKAWLTVVVSQASKAIFSITAKVITFGLRGRYGPPPLTAKGITFRAALFLIILLI